MYAKGTTVASSKTEAEIKYLLSRRGSTKIATFDDGFNYSIAFEYEGCSFMLKLPLPDPEHPKFWEFKRGSVTHRREASGAREKYEDELNRRWRAFGAVIKAKIIAVEEGISTMQDEFIGNALVGGRTVAEVYVPQLKQMAIDGKIAPLGLEGRR